MPYVMNRTFGSKECSKRKSIKYAFENIDEHSFFKYEITPELSIIE